MSETTTKPKRKRKSTGRPKGSRTKDRAPVTSVVSVDKCPACSVTLKPKNKRLAREGRASGTCKGQPYGYYKMYRCNCSKCDKALVLTEYQPV